MDRAPAPPTSSQHGSTAAVNGDGGDSKHPFENADGLLVVFPNDAIDVEEEARLYDELRAATQSVSPGLSEPFQTSFPITSHRLSNSPGAQDEDDENYLQVLKRHDTRSLRNTEFRPAKATAPPSILSNDIWLGDNSGSSGLFAREVEIRGWTSVGDKLGGAYIGQWRFGRSRSSGLTVGAQCTNALCGPRR